jgi:polar amino acid transport system ATP-binding protein
MIAVRGLVKRHGNLEVLHGLDLDVRRGEVAVLIGPSGSGKSTLLRCLNGLDRFQGGRVAIEGAEPLEADCPDGERQRVLSKVRRLVGMVFQSFNLFPHRSVLENVTEAPIHVLKMPRAEAEERAKALLHRVGMADKLHCRPRQLSGGQQQRVAIARALAMGPEAVLFDEPTSALDPRMTSEVLGVMTDLARDGQTMVVVTHAMRFARQVATTVHVLGQGRIVESGPPCAVLDDPREAATRELLEAEVRASG